MISCSTLANNQEGMKIYHNCGADPGSRFGSMARARPPAPTLQPSHRQLVSPGPGHRLPRRPRGVRGRHRQRLSARPRARGLRAVPQLRGGLGDPSGRPRVHLGRQSGRAARARGSASDERRGAVRVAARHRGEARGRLARADAAPGAPRERDPQTDAARRARAGRRHGLRGAGG